MKNFWLELKKERTQEEKRLKIKLAHKEFLTILHRIFRLKP